MMKMMILKETDQLFVCGNWRYLHPTVDCVKKRQDLQSSLQISQTSRVKMKWTVHLSRFLIAAERAKVCLQQS